MLGANVTHKGNGDVAGHKLPQYVVDFSMSFILPMTLTKIVNIN